MINVKNLTQIYKSGKGIFDLNFEVKEGEVFGYLGPNGAGKSTTIRNILGFTNASEVEVLVFDKNTRVHAAEIANDIGYLPGEIAFFDNFTGIEFLEFIANMRGLNVKERRDDLIERFELEVKTPIRKMSKGMKQKVGIVAAFMHDPKVLILDEPTSGLDPLMQNVFMDLLREEKEKGKTILMSSHIFEEVERICDRAAIIKEGRLITIEDFSSLKEKKEDILVIKLSSENDALLKESIEAVKVVDATYRVTIKGNYQEVFSVLSKYDVVSLDKKTQTIEEIFMKYYGKDVQ